MRYQDYQHYKSFTDSFRKSGLQGMSLFNVGGKVKPRELVDVGVGEVLCGIPCKDELAVGAIDFLERHGESLP